MFSTTVLVFMTSIILQVHFMFPCRSLVVNVEIKLGNMDKSAQFQTPAQNIHFIDLTVDSLGCFYKNIGSRQNKYSQWMYLLTYHLETTALTDFRNFTWVWMTSKGHFRWEWFFLCFTGWSCIYVMLVNRLSCFDLSLSHLAKLFGKSSEIFFFSLTDIMLSQYH